MLGHVVRACMRMECMAYMPVGRIGRPIGASAHWHISMPAAGQRASRPPTAARARAAPLHGIVIHAECARRYRSRFRRGDIA